MDVGINCCELEAQKKTARGEDRGTMYEVPARNGRRAGKAQPSAKAPKVGDCALYEVEEAVVGDRR